MKKMPGHAYFTNELLESKILVVGAGGIGCELLKNLAMAGFTDLEVIDLDTIDVSNLNRQFLFRREHVGLSKAKVASDAAIAMRPNMKIVHHHDSIFNDTYDVSYFKKFAVVLNALDNLAARRHVNRLCISSGVALIDGGTSGFKGQTRVIKRYVTECYDCVDHEVPKTFATCTIRNTPSEFIHCVTWAKFLFNQLFGEPDPDEDVSPNEEQQGEQNGDAQMANGNGEENGRGESVSTRQFAASVNYDAQQMYNKLFVRDIETLLSMEDLWKQRREPVPFRIDDIVSLPQPANALPLNSNWSIEKWISEFVSSIQELAQRFEQEAAKDKILSWDKDDEASLKFVAACANIRAFIFHIPDKSLFEVKSTAGNIIPAIASSNAIVAGMMIVEAYKVIANKESQFQSGFITLRPTPRGKIISNDATVKPNPKCYVCAEKREIFVELNTAKMTQKTFMNTVIKGGFGMIAPDVTNFASGAILVSSEELDNKGIENCTLAELSVVNGSQLDCDDFQQAFNFKLFIVDADQMDVDEYRVALDSDKQTDSGNGQTDEPAAKRKKISGSEVVTNNDPAKRKRLSNEPTDKNAKRSRTDIQA